MKLSIWLLVSLIFSTAAASERLKVCSLGPDRSQTMAVVRGDAIASTHVYYLEQNGELSPLFETIEQSRGSEVNIACVGKNQRALVVSGEFTANSLQGFAMSYSPLTNRLERLDFAEKNRPAWLYLTSDKMAVAIPTSGYGETSSKYVVYRRRAGNTIDVEVNAVDRLPSPPGFEIIPLRAMGKPP